MKIKREEGSERGQKFLELNQKHGREGLKERQSRAETNMEMMYCVDILKLTGDFLHVKKYGKVKQLKEYQKIETLEHASQYIIDEIKKDNIAKAIREDEEKNGAKRKCIDEIKYENHFVKLEADLRAIQSVIDWLPSTRADNKWKEFSSHPRLITYANSHVNGAKKRSK